MKMEKNNLNIEILHHRNYETEVKLSKTRKYIKHSSREQNHRLQNLHQELRDWNHDYNCLENDFVEINGRSQFLETKCLNLEKNLKENRRQVIEINKYNEYGKFQEMNSKVLLKSLIEERYNTKDLLNKLNESNKQCILANSAFEETRENMKIYKVALEELEMKEKDRCKLQETKNDCATVNVTGEENNNVIILKKVIEELNTDLNKEKIQTKRLKSDLENSKRQHVKDKKDMKDTIKDLKWREERLIRQLNEEVKVTDNKEEIETLKVTISKLQSEKDLKETQSTEIFNKGVQTGVALCTRNKDPVVKSSGITLFHGKPMPVPTQQGARLVKLQPGPMPISNQHGAQQKVRFAANNQYVQLPNQSGNKNNDDWEYFPSNNDDYYEENY